MAEFSRPPVEGLNQERLIICYVERWRMSDFAFERQGETVRTIFTIGPPAAPHRPAPLRFLESQCNKARGVRAFTRRRRPSFTS